MSAKIVPETQVVFDPGENSYRAKDNEVKDAAERRAALTRTILEEMRRQNAPKPTKCCDQWKCVIL